MVVSLLPRELVSIKSEKKNAAVHSGVLVEGV